MTNSSLSSKFYLTTVSFIITDPRYCCGTTPCPSTKKCTVQVPVDYCAGGCCSPSPPPAGLTSSLERVLGALPVYLIRILALGGGDLIPVRVLPYSYQHAHLMNLGFWLALVGKHAWRSRSARPIASPIVNTIPRHHH